MDLFEKIDRIAMEAMPKEEFCAMWGRTVEEEEKHVLDIVHRQLERAGIRQRPAEKDH